MLRSFSHLQEISQRYEIPSVDTLLIAFNVSGIVGPYSNKRIRFAISPLKSDKKFYFAVCVNSRTSPFFIKEKGLFLFRKRVAEIERLENDQAELSYFRKENNSLVLNTNSRSFCSGCSFCGVNIQDKNDTRDLTKRESLRDHLRKILEAKNLKDFSDLEEVTLCTRCFLKEEELVSHLVAIREEMKRLGFDGTIKYIGSRIRSDRSLKTIKEKVAPFAYYLTLECFEKREERLSHHKLDFTVDDARNLLAESKRMGFETSVLYVLGLDTLKNLTSNFEKLAPVLTQFPVVNLYQNYKAEHEELRPPQARKLDYYLKARKRIEDIFKDRDLKPKLWENYRSPWYTSYNNRSITSPEYQTYAPTT